MTVLGFSSSGIKGGNVDRMVKQVLELSGQPYEFVRLSGLSYSPCKACVYLCAKDNLCKLEDDLKEYYPKIVSASALILGTPAYFNNMNGFMTVFLERLWALRHQRFPIEGKPFFVVSTGDRLEGAEKAIESVRRRMTSYKADFLGGAAFESENFPCYSCGFGHSCQVGGLYRTYGEAALQKLKSGPVRFSQWENCAQVSEKIDALGKELRLYANSIQG